MKFVYMFEGEYEEYEDFWFRADDGITQEDLSAYLRLAKEAYGEQGNLIDKAFALYRKEQTPEHLDSWHSAMLNRRPLEELIEQCSNGKLTLIQSDFTVNLTDETIVDR